MLRDIHDYDNGDVGDVGANSEYSAQQIEEELESLRCIYDESQFKEIDSGATVEFIIGGFVLRVYLRSTRSKRAEEKEKKEQGEQTATGRRNEERRAKGGGGGGGGGVRGKQESVGGKGMGRSKGKEYTLRVHDRHACSKYPEKNPPAFDIIRCPLSLDREALKAELLSLFEPGEVVLFEWTAHLQELWAQIEAQQECEEEQRRQVGRGDAEACAAAATTEAAVAAHRLGGEEEEMDGGSNFDIAPAFKLIHGECMIIISCTSNRFSSPTLSTPPQR